MVATDLAAKRGVLFKQAVSLEQASKIEAIIFDKTGTLTVGKPRVTDVVANGLSEDELLRLAGAAEARSGHPLAQAVLDELERRGVSPDAAIEDFENIAGHGVRVTVDGRRVLVGAARLLQRFDVPLGPLEQTANQLVDQGKTIILVALEGRAAGVIAAADIVRPNAAQAIADLKVLGIEPVMMTGDTKRTADAVAKQVGIERVFAKVLPEDKAAAVDRMARSSARACCGSPPLSDR